MEFADEAISGTKRERMGLNAMLQGAEAGEFGVVYVHSLSRLARESVITLPMLKKLVYSYNVRFISVTEGIDSARDGWEVIAAIFSVMHERYIKELSANVLRGQEGALLSGYSVGDWCFGYASEPVPGTESHRAGRNTKPRMQYVIDEVTSAWVVRIFHWFVQDGRSIRWIVRELNRRSAPKDHRSTSTEWYHGLVVSLLSNPKYVGRWPWGEMQNVRDPETGIIRQEPRPDEECEMWSRDLPDLRIIDDDAFAAVQARLNENTEKFKHHRNEKGQLTGSLEGGFGSGSVRLLSGLMTCAMCGRPFVSMGKRMKCRGHNQSVCEVSTSLPTELAERLVLDVIGQRIAENPVWFARVHAEAVKAYREFRGSVPDAIQSKERELKQLDQRIERLVDAVEAGSAPEDVNTRLTDRRRKRDQLATELERLRKEANRHPGEPTEEWLRDRLNDLYTVLHDPNPAANTAIQKLIPDGITLEVSRVPGRKQKFLRGRFRLSPVHAVSVVGGGCNAEASSDQDDEIALDFVDMTEVDALCDEAKRLWDEGLMCADIATQMGVHRSRVTAMIKEWYARRGEAKPDGRLRRSTLEKKQLEPPKYVAIADEVMELYNADELLDDIAIKLGVDRNTVTKSVSYWHESHGLSVADGRGRRKRLAKKSRKRSS